MAAPAGDGGGVTHRAAVPRPLLWRGDWGAMASLSRCGLALWGWRGTANPRKGVLAVAATGAVHAMGCPSSSSSAIVRASSGGSLAHPRP
jgi:hypothetical protein